MDTQQSLLRANRIRPWEPVLWLLAFAAPALMPSQALMINEIAYVALFAVSLDLVLGYGGIVSLGHTAFFGVGAYAAALFCKHVMPDPHLGLLVAMAVTALLGLVASFTVLRGTDLTRLMVTLGVALLLYELANKLDWITGGMDGIQGLMFAPVLGKFEFDLSGQTAAYYSLAVLFVLFLAARRIVRSPFGATLEAIRDNRLRAMAIGIPVHARLVSVYTIAAAMAGARFAGSPGYTQAVGKACHDLGLPLLPGVATGSEIMAAQEDGYTALKFFPALQAGGTAMLKAWGGPFGDVRFCPTGGVSVANAHEFLALSNVECVGGSWLTPADAVAQGDWARITQLAREAVALARS